LFAKVGEIVLNSPYLKYFIQQLGMKYHVFKALFRKFYAFEELLLDEIKTRTWAFSYIGTLAAALCRLLLKMYTAAMLELLVVEKPKCSYKHDV
jgi:hypothetical protein